MLEHTVYVVMIVRIFSRLSIGIFVVFIIIVVVAAIGGYGGGVVKGRRKNIQKWIKERMNILSYTHTHTHVCDAHDDRLNVSDHDNNLHSTIYNLSVH